jgi:hypothetical protein
MKDTCKSNCRTKPKSRCMTARKYVERKPAGQVGRENPKEQVCWLTFMQMFVFTASESRRKPTKWVSSWRGSPKNRFARTGERNKKG